MGIMALLSQAIREKEFDLRIMERSLSKGTVTTDVHDKHTETLVDDADYAIYTSVEELYESIKGKSSLRP